MNDEELRREYQRSLNGAPPGAHPEPEQLEQLLSGTLPEAARLALLEHVLRCPTCGPELDLLRAAHEGARAAERHLPTRWLALAAAALIIVGVGALTLRSKRITAASDVMRGRPHAMSLIEPAPAVRVALPVHLAWHALDGAASYRVELLSTGGDLLAAWTTTDTIAVVPDSVRIVANGSYDVWVRATLADRTEIGSPLVRFSVK